MSIQAQIINAKNNIYMLLDVYIQNQTYLRSQINLIEDVHRRSFHVPFLESSAIRQSSLVPPFWSPVGIIKGFSSRRPFPLAICKCVSSVKPETIYKVLILNISRLCNEKI